MADNTADADKLEGQVEQSESALNAGAKDAPEDQPKQGGDDAAAPKESKNEIGSTPPSVKPSVEQAPMSNGEPLSSPKLASSKHKQDDNEWVDSEFEAAALAEENEDRIRRKEQRRLSAQLPRKTCIYCDAPLPRQVSAGYICDYCGTEYRKSQPPIDWKCANCGFPNKGENKECYVCELTKHKSRIRDIEPLRTSYKLPEPEKTPKRPDREKAMKKLRAMVENVAKKVSTGPKRYEDTFGSHVANKFMAENLELLEKTKKIRDYYEIERDELMKDAEWPLFEKPSPSDVIHGACDNSWLLCAMSFLAREIEGLFVNKDADDKGCYGVLLCDGGVWKGIVVCGFFPIGADGKLLFAKGEKNQLWVPLLEKAVAMLVGSYGALEHNYNYNTCALKLLTGFGTDVIFTDEKMLDSHEKEVMFSKLQAAFKENGTYVYTHTEAQDVAGLEYSAEGLYEKEAYLVTDLKQCPDAEPMLLVTRVNDPESWKQAQKNWSSGSSVLQLSSGTPRYGETVGSWMPLHKFQKYFKKIEIFRRRSQWYENNSMQDLPTSRDLVLRVTKLVITKTTALDIYVQDKRQHLDISRKEDETGWTRRIQNPRIDERRRLTYGLEMIMMILDENEKLVASDMRRCSSHIYWSGCLPAGQYYIACVSLSRWKFVVDDIVHFNISIHSKEPVKTSLVGLHKDTLTKALLNLVFKTGTIDKGTQSNLEPGVEIHKLLPKQWPGMLVAVRNTSSSSCIIKTRFGESKNMVSHRCSGKITETSDVIPPNMCQLVQILYRRNPSKEFTRWMQVNAHMTSLAEEHVPEPNDKTPYIHLAIPIMSFVPGMCS